MAAETLDWGQLVAYLRDEYGLVKQEAEGVIVDGTIILDDGREVTRRARISLGSDVVRLDVALRGGTVVRHRLWRDAITADLVDRTLLGVLEDAWQLEESRREDRGSATLFSHFI